MSNLVVDKEQKTTLTKFLKEHPEAELVDAYLTFIQKKFKIQPVLYHQDDVIYQSGENLLEKLEKKGKIWRETEIKIDLGTSDVDENTKKIYICPFTGRVFGDNTHPNPQDAIYDWVAKCPENTERVGGLRVKRFFVSEDPQVIEHYIAEDKKVEKTLLKTVFSSAVSGKLFNNKEAVSADFREKYFTDILLPDVPKQDKYEIEEGFLEFIQSQLAEQKVTEFIEALSEMKEFSSQVEAWVS